MRLLYEATNSLEAHMILNLLEGTGLSARIDGEYLQGGVGDLQAMGLVRVMVDDLDYTDAKVIIEKWESSQPKQVQAVQVKEKSRFGTLIIGFLFGIAVMTVYYNTPVTEDGIDLNGDGNIDEKWTFVNHMISKSEVDRNFDGEVDLINLFDRKGIIETSSADDDFNGNFETEVYYKYGNAVLAKLDTNDDGFKDYRADFRNDLVEKISYFDPKTNKAVKIQYFGPFKLLSAEFDSDGDGVMDTLYEYDSIEEISRKSKKQSNKSISHTLKATGSAE